MNSQATRTSAPTGNARASLPSVPVVVNSGGAVGMETLQHPDNLVCSGDPLSPHHFLRAGEAITVASATQADRVRLSDFEEFYSLRCPNFQRAVGVYAAYYFRERRRNVPVGRSLNLAPGSDTVAAAPNVSGGSAARAGSAAAQAPAFPPGLVPASASQLPAPSPVLNAPPAAPTPASTPVRSSSVPMPQPPLPPNARLVNYIPPLQAPMRSSTFAPLDILRSPAPISSGGQGGLVAGVMASVPVANPLATAVQPSDKVSKAAAAASSGKSAQPSNPPGPRRIITISDVESNESDGAKASSKKRGKKKEVDNSNQAKKKVKSKAVTRVNQRPIRVTVEDDDGDVIPIKSLPSYPSASSPPPPPPSSPAPPTSPARPSSPGDTPTPRANRREDKASYYSKNIAKGPSLPVASMPERDREIFHLLQSTYGGPSAPRVYFGPPTTSNLSSGAGPSSSRAPTSSNAGPSGSRRTPTPSPAAGPSTAAPDPSPGAQSNVSTQYSIFSFDTNEDREVTKLLADLEKEGDEANAGVVDNDDDDDMYMDDSEDDDMYLD
ncbi:hypothetical protein CVT26_006142 [Gymnopilus dilepis]|uniref:Uncharacterized protein n=1 Tax=Gymnopilus dilepis TaxID=231916 RepID=A0A409WG56_9AGAR|nr:hypothetical protein CVT26_006142 [Gymnopilus dilepis]